METLTSIAKCEKNSEGVCAGVTQVASDVGQIVNNAAILTHWFVACEDDPTKTCPEFGKTMIGNMVGSKVALFN
jgi:hypothetical protein